MMQEELIAQLAYYLVESERKIVQVWATLSEEQIWWRPNEQCLAPANQLIHLTGNLRQWVGTALGGLPEVRTRDAEFAARAGKGKNEILRNFLEQLAFAKTRLTSASNLLDEHVVQGHQTTELGIWIHMTEHLSYHTGQLIYAAKTMNAKAFNFYEDWDLG